MQKIILITVTLYLFLFSNAYAQDTQQPFSAVQTLFAALSIKDGVAMRETSTENFELLEAGEVWDMDKLVSAVESNKSKRTRRNFFAVITSNINDDKAWVSYWNKAVISNAEGKSQSLIWLESAVLIKRDDIWLIEMLHSTRVNPNQPIPGNIKLQEYVATQP